MSPTLNFEVPLSGRRKRLFAGHGSAELARKVWNEREVIEAARELSGLSMPEYARRALLMIARRDLANAAALRQLKPGEKQAGLAGAADPRIAAAYAQLKRSGRPITPSALRRLSKAHLDLVKAWIAKQGDTLEIPVTSMEGVRVGPRRP
jgi:hypothetical protein